MPGANSDNRDFVNETFCGRDCENARGKPRSRLQPQSERNLCVTHTIPILASDKFHGLAHYFVCNGCVSAPSAHNGIWNTDFRHSGSAPHGFALPPAPRFRLFDIVNRLRLSAIARARFSRTLRRLDCSNHASWRVSRAMARLIS